VAGASAAAVARSGESSTPSADDAPPSQATSKDSPDEDSDVNISDGDLDACVSVLERLSKDPSRLLAGPRFRRLRKAFGPVHAAMSERDAAALENGRRRALRKEDESRRARQADADRRHLDTTGLRRGRIERLRGLCEEPGRLLALGVSGDGDDGGIGCRRLLCQVPDGAVREEGRSLVSGVEAAAGSDADGAVATNGPELFKPRQCYSCKARFGALHHFYAQLCPKCASLNYRMRHCTADLSGRYALLTGSRVKVGFEIALKLLRAGATVVATTRFPADAAKRYAAEADFEAWRERLHVHALDLRDVVALESFCDYLRATLPRLDVVVNNACQTIRRPASYYAHLLAFEAEVEAGQAGAPLAPLLAQQASRREGRRQARGGAIRWTDEGRDDHDPPTPTPAQLSQLHLTTEDAATAVSPLGSGEQGGAVLPAGQLDVNGQQIDLRATNSWRLKLPDVSTPELCEVLAINTLAPFIINARLQPLLAAAADAAGAAFIVNVSAMEGKFYRHKTANHPHTNMAKAALNMMTRTSAAELAASHRIYMTAVDTGWINDENPRERAARTAETSHFQTPLDEVDAAARVLHPVFEGVSTGETPLHGVFLKDFVETEW